VNLEDPRGEGFLQGLKRGILEYALILGLIAEPAEEALPHVEVPIELIFGLQKKTLKLPQKDFRRRHGGPGRGHFEAAVSEPSMVGTHAADWVTF